MLLHKQEQLMSKRQQDRKIKPKKTRYIPVSKFNAFQPWPTPQGLRNRIHAARRGTDPDFLKCVKYAGGRVLIDEEAFLQWLINQSV